MVSGTLLDLSQGKGGSPADARTPSQPQSQSSTPAASHLFAGSSGSAGLSGPRSASSSQAGAGSPAGHPGPGPGPGPGSNGSSGIPGSGPGPGPGPAVATTPQYYSADVVSVASWEVTAKSMDGVELAPATIRDLYREFVERYHVFMPVVDVSVGPEELYKLSPALFWTIMAVAARRYTRDNELMMKLAPLQRTCLAELTLSPTSRFASGGTQQQFNVASVYAVQAFIICTLWPPLTSSISADSSWNTAGIAILHAIRSGLHCPGYARDFSRIKADNVRFPKVNEQIRTWICCNVVSQTVGAMFGYPAVTSFDSTALMACQRSSGLELPDSLRQLMTIAHLEHEIEKALNSNTKDPLGLADASERLSLIQIMTDKLAEVEMAMEGRCTDLARFALLTARLHLMVYYFFDNADYTDLQLKQGLLKAYNAALAMMQHIDDVSRRDRLFMRYLPQVYVQSLWQSTTVVNKLYHSNFAQYIDTTLGKDLYFRTTRHIARASIFRHDQAYRAVEIMQHIWQLYSELESKHHVKANPATVSVRTRMAASVFVDSLWTMREECGIRSHAPTELNQRVSPDEDIVSGRSVAPAQNQNGTSIATAPNAGHATANHHLLHQHHHQPHNGALLPYTPHSSEGSDGAPGGYMPPNGPTPDNLFDWGNVDMVWRDVDTMMTEFGFHVDEM